ncbi:MAG: Stp1/IreP family PP2C-type Ser/Thr phosphatase [Acidimicrobiales bacterium]
MAGRTALRWGGATHVGRVRSTNDDNYMARDDVGLWAVADGMGGHRGGDVASAIACEALGRSYTDRTVDGLIEAIEQANDAVYETGSSDPDLSGMGTTVVALAVVDEDGEELLAVANVGDSRVYRYSVGDLEQLTDDHSLVADLVREGTLSPEEAAVHPQRNIVTRALGVSDRVPVDTITIEPVAGDRYVLCSDGLFNEVPEPGISAVLHRLDDPAEAADELVRLAVEGGGRDNVTVVVVDVVDDAGRAGAASAAFAVGAPSGLASRAEPVGVTGTDDGDAGGDVALEAPGATNGSEDGGGRGGVALETRPRGRRLTWRVLLFSLLVLALVGGAFATIQWYGRSTYFVGFEGDRVAIFKGRPGGVLWLNPVLEETTDIERSDVPADTRDDLEAGKEQSSLGDAHRYVDRLTERADALAAEATTTTTRPTTTTSAPRTTTTQAP